MLLMALSYVFDAIKNSTESDQSTVALGGMGWWGQSARKRRFFPVGETPKLNLMAVVLSGR